VLFFHLILIASISFYCISSSMASFYDLVFSGYGALGSFTFILSFISCNGFSWGMRTEKGT